MPDLNALRQLFMTDPERPEDVIGPAPVPPPVEPVAQPDTASLLQNYLGQKYQDRLKQAEAEAEAKTGGWGPMLAEFAANVGGAIAGKGGNAYSAQFDRMRQNARNQIVNPVRQERENALQGVQDQQLVQQIGENAALNDPNDPRARLYSDLAKRYGINLPGLTARQGKDVLPALSLMSESDAKRQAAADKNAVTFDEKGVAHPIDPNNPAHVSKANEENARMSERQGTASRQERILAASLGEKDYARQMKETERKEDEQARYVPNVGTFADKTQADFVRKADNAHKNMRYAMNELRRLRAAPWNPANKEIALRTALDAQMALKQGMNLGTLSEGDLKMLDKLVPSDVNSPDVLGTVTAQLEALERSEQAKWKNMLSGFSYKPDPKRAEFEALKAKAGK